MIYTVILLLGIYPIISALVLLPTYHQVPLRPLPLLYLLPNSPLFTQTSVQPQVSTLDDDLVYSATPNLTGRSNFLEDIPMITRLAATYGRDGRGPRNIDLCYFVGKDIFTSHVRCNPNWADGTNEGVRRYINEMTYETNRMVGVNNLRLVWKGPFVRTETDQEQKGEAVLHDVLSVADKGCDAVIFLLFNHFSEDCETTTSGHKFGGVSYGGMCEVPQGRGYGVVVDQGFLKDAWTGPQILAHHLLLMLTSDLNDRSKHCPNKDSLLFPKLYPGEQRVDGCVVSKLKRSGVSRRACLRD